MAHRDRVWWIKGGRAWNLKVSEAFVISLRVDRILNALDEKWKIKNPQAPRSTNYSLSVKNQFKLSQEILLWDHTDCAGGLNLYKKVAKNA